MKGIPVFNVQPPQPSPKKKPERYRAPANPAMAEAMRERGRSSVAQPHTLKSHKGSRSNRRQQAIRDHTSS
jgi:hypothetical protein